MALKECPTCRQFMNAIAKRCRCGHVFDPSTCVKPPTTRCPLCGQLADDGAGACDCSYDFSTGPLELKAQLVRRNRHGWFWILGGVLVVLSVGGMWFLALPILLGVGVAAGGAWMIARGVSSISWTRGELASLEARIKALPEARVIERA